VASLSGVEVPCAFTTWISVGSRPASAAPTAWPARARAPVRSGDVVRIRAGSVARHTASGAARAGTRVCEGLEHDDARALGDHEASQSALNGREARVGSSLRSDSARSWQ